MKTFVPGNHVVAATIVCLALTSAGAAGAASADESCARLASVPVPAAAIMLPTSGAVVMSAVMTPATGADAALVAEHCKVRGAIKPVDPSAPDIMFELDLPTEWNGKTLMFGGGGFDGTIPNVSGNFTVGPVGRPVAVTLGYATFGSDSGHQGSNKTAPGAAVDGAFGLNDEALRNYAGDALKKTRDAAVFLITQRYGRTPARSYFAGGSNGGREAFAVIQRWPQDFDGAIAAYPYWNAGTVALAFGRFTRAFAQPGAFPSSAKQSLLVNAISAACDGIDGAKDGIISNVAACKFDIGSIRCPNGADTGDTCWSDAQIAAIKAYDDPVTLDYRRGGETSYPGWPVLSGANFIGPLGSAAPSNPAPREMAGYSHYWDQLVRYSITRDPNYNYLEFDPQKPGIYQQRLDYVVNMLDVTGTDLTAFKGRGGKLLIIHGLADPIVSPRSTIDYWNRLQAKMGAQGLAEFARFYTVPGYGHGPASPAAFMAAWDSLSALDAWVEKGVAPAAQVVTDRNEATKGRTRPLCEYPNWPKYNGSGDLNAAASFTCVATAEAAR
jgi:hypothetical protein